MDSYCSFGQILFKNVPFEQHDDKHGKWTIRHRLQLCANTVRQIFICSANTLPRGKHCFCHWQSLLSL